MGCPVIFLVGLSVLFMMRGDTAHEWHTIWQKEDISITFRENYYASIFLFGLPMGLLILCVHLGVNKLNEQRGNILYSPSVSWVFHGLVFLSIFGLMGLLIFPQQETGTWKDKAHLSLTLTMFLASINYQIFNSVCLAWFVYSEKRRRTLLNFSCILYFVSMTGAGAYCSLKWRANHSYVEDDEGVKHLARSTPHYEWLSVFCMVMCYMGFCSYNTVLELQEIEFVRQESMRLVRQESMRRAETERGNWES